MIDRRLIVAVVDLHTPETARLLSGVRSEVRGGLELKLRACASPDQNQKG